EIASSSDWSIRFISESPERDTYQKQGLKADRMSPTALPIASDTDKDVSDALMSN
ncbi:hypothetical protein AMTR_s01191p00010440, partial [Amborella trichopoda]